MKIYIHANEDSSSHYDFSHPIKIVVDIEISDRLFDMVAASAENKRLVDEDGNLILNTYEELIDTIDVIEQQMGLKRLKPITRSRSYAPNGDPSNSVYLDYGLKDHTESQELHMVFFLRVSDHRDLHGYNNEYANDRLGKYKEEDEVSKNNGNDGYMRPFIRRITVGKTIFSDTDSAIDEFERLVKEYIRSEARGYKKYHKVSEEDY